MPMNRHLTATETGIIMIESDIVPVADTIVLTQQLVNKPALGERHESGISPYHPHSFIGMRYFDDAEGTMPVIPTAGDVTIRVKTCNTLQFEDIPDNKVSANKTETISVDANLVEVECVPNVIIGATHMMLVVTQNRT